MVGAKLLQFPPAGGVNAPPRPPSSNAAGGIGFAGMVDDAVGASSSPRRDAAVLTAPAARPRRSEVVTPRATETHAAPSSRRTTSAARKPAVDRADDVTSDEKPAPTGDRSSEAPAAEAAASQSEEAQARIKAAAGDAAVEDCAAADHATAEASPDDVEATVAVAAARAELSAAAGAKTEDAGPSAATRSGVPVAGEAKGDAKDAKEADARIGADTPAADTGLPARPGANRSASVPEDTPEASGEPIVEFEPEDVDGEPQDAAAPPRVARRTDSVTDTSAPSGAKPARTDTAAAFAEAGSAVEAVADTDSSGGADVADAGTQDQPPPREAPGTPGQAAHAVAVAPGATDGVRFTVNVAAGSAAYASAAPRHEEAVLPQIVQSIRVQAAQGTSEARVQLKPEHLGALNITLKVEQGQVTATIQASVAAVRQWIESHESSLRQALSEQGLQLTRLVVQPDEEPADHDSREQNETRRQPQRRSWRDDDVTFEVLA